MARRDVVWFPQRRPVARLLDRDASTNRCRVCLRVFTPGYPVDLRTADQQRRASEVSLAI